MTTTLDITALYGGTLPNGRFQTNARERMTKAAYDEARAGRLQTVIWSIVAVVHIMIVIFGLGIPGFIDELVANPAYAFGLAIWIVGDITFLMFAPTLYHDYQATMDKLEGKTPQRR
ncbi:MAG TPA: hypothetical protein VJM46_04125 [Candidatus Saccharimonadales bacterium]|nr:hypothetical protein [Candidatus Saccharimonadales bacterium]